VWCDRRFEFVAAAHRQPFSGRIFFRAYAKKDLFVQDLAGMLVAMELFSGFGIDAEPFDVAPVTLIRAINTSVIDYKLDFKTVNGICGGLERALEKWEAKSTQSPPPRI